jgi:NhaP-type Na+/H+ or K+/H+ antiporter
VPEREIILVMTYLVVVSSILVQGLTIGPLTRRWLAADAIATEPPSNPENASPAVVEMAARPEDSGGQE